MNYYEDLRERLRAHLIDALACLVLEFVTPPNPTDKDIGKYSIFPLMCQVANRKDCVIGAARHGNISIILCIYDPKEDIADVVEGLYFCGRQDLANKMSEHAWNYIKSANTQKISFKMTTGILVTNKCAEEILRKLNKLCINHSFRGACEGGHMQYINSILKAAPNLYYGVEGACRSSRADIAIYILQQAKSRGRDISFALPIACKYGVKDLASYIIKSGVHPNMAVLEACKNNRSDMLNYLIDQGACHIICSMQICKFDRLHMAISLISRGVNPQLIYRYARTPEMRKLLSDEIHRFNDKPHQV